MPCTIKAIQGRDCTTSNNSGVRAIYAIPASDVVGFGTVTNFKASVITKATAKSFVKHEFTRQKGDFKLNFTADDIDAPNVANDVTIYCGKVSPELMESLDSHRGVELILVAKDSNGQFLIVGDKDFPCHMSKVEGGTGTGEAGQLNGVTITFKLPQAQRFNYFFTGAEADLLVPGV